MRGMASKCIDLVTSHLVGASTGMGQLSGHALPNKACGRNRGKATVSVRPVATARHWCATCRATNGMLRTACARAACCFLERRLVVSGGGVGGVCALQASTMEHVGHITS